MMHRKCAAVAIQHCPSLKRDVENGTLMIRQVLRYRVQCAIMSPEYVESETGEAVKALGHAKIELLARSEEYTSELQSLMRISYAVFCLKKKKKKKQHKPNTALTLEKMTATSKKSQDYWNVDEYELHET